MKIYYDDVFLKHKPLGYHPENPKRLEIIMEALKERGFWKDIVKPRIADFEELLQVHEEEYVKFIKERCKVGYIDTDTYVCEDSWISALTAFGCAIQCVENAINEKDLHLALVRPPGHHAGKRGIAFNAPSQGFCLFNNIAGAVVKAKDFFDRVIVIDFDVHHGNGTQEIFWGDLDVIHIDFHEYGIYPGTGEVEDTDGAKINIALPHYSNDNDYIYAWREIVEPILEDLKPKLILVSAGFDAFINDGLATMELTEKFYSFAGSKIRNFSVVAILEGGYSVGLKKGLLAFVEGYLKGYEVEDFNPRSNVVEVVNKLKEVHRELLPP